MHGRTVIGGCPVAQDVFGVGSPVCGSSPFVGVPEQVMELADFDLGWALDGLFPVSDGSVEKDCWEISNK